MLSILKVSSPHTKVLELPSISTIRKGRTVLGLVAHSLAAYHLASAPYWKQLHTDGTSRRQSALQNIVISYQDECGELISILLTTNIIPENEQSATICESILNAIEEKGKLLTKWRDVHELLYDDDHDIPLLLLQK